jgi:calcium-dependent protein kinase
MKSVISTLTNFKAPKKLQKEVMNVMLKFVSIEKLNELKNIFIELDTDHTGFITEKELRKAMQNLGFDEAAEEIKTIVHKITYLRQGKIPYTEFLVAYLHMKKNIDEQMIFETFNYFDKEQKGYLTKKDIASVIRRSSVRRDTEAVN